MSRSSAAQRDSNATQEEKQQKKHKKHSKQYSEEPTEEETPEQPKGETPEEEQPTEETPKANKYIDDDDEDDDELGFGKLSTDDEKLKYIRFAEMFAKSTNELFGGVDVNKTYCAMVFINSISAAQKKDKTVIEGVKTIKFSVLKFSFIDKEGNAHIININKLFNDFYEAHKDDYEFRNCTTDYINIKSSYMCDTTDNGIYTIRFKLYLGTNNNLVSDINKCYLSPVYSKDKNITTLTLLESINNEKHDEHKNKMLKRIPNFVSKDNYKYRARPQCTIPTFDIGVKHDIIDNPEDID